MAVSLGDEETRHEARAVARRARHAGRVRRPRIEDVREGSYLPACPRACGAGGAGQGNGSALPGSLRQVQLPGQLALEEAGARHPPGAVRPQPAPESRGAAAPGDGAVPEARGGGHARPAQGAQGSCRPGASGAQPAVRERSPRESQRQAAGDLREHAGARANGGGQREGDQLRGRRDGRRGGRAARAPDGTFEKPVEVKVKAPTPAPAPAK